MPPGPELWNLPASTYTVYRTSKPAVAVKQYIPDHRQLLVQRMDTCHAATRSADIEASYFQSCLTHDHILPNDGWADSLQLDEATMNPHQYEDSGLGLDAFDDDRTPTAASYDTAKCFMYPETLAGQDFGQFAAPSPDRRSMSSFSEASSGLASELPELSTVTECPYLRTDYSSTFEQAPLTPEGTPRFSHHSCETPRHRFVPEPSSRYPCRAIPFTVDHSRSRSSSASSFLLSRTQRSSPFTHSDASDYSFQDLDFSAQDTCPSILPSSNPNMNSSSVSSSLFCSETHLECSLILLPGPCQSKGCQPYGSSDPPSSGLPGNLISNTQVEHRHEGPAWPPDLFGALREGQILPPDKDMDPLDSDLKPLEQELRFEGDLYTPRFVRGRGNKREGWCGICKPGRWLVLKNSGYWYDKSFSHGISATGTTFDGPSETRRMEGNPEVWEGLCKSCGEWIALISSKKKGIPWFRHTSKCHTHYKLKDAPKRRREVSHARPRPAKLPKLISSTPESWTSSPDFTFSKTRSEPDPPDAYGS